MLRKKYLICDTDRHGNNRFYVRIPGKPKVRIHHSPGTAAFENSYRRTIDGLSPDAPDVVEDLPIDPSCKSMYVYVLDGNRGVKIGVTSNIQKRIKSLQTGHPGLLTCYALFVIKSSHAYRVENKAHKLLNRFRLHGEWFSIDPDEATVIVTRAAMHLKVPICEVPNAGQAVPLI